MNTPNQSDENNASKPEPAATVTEPVEPGAEPPQLNAGAAVRCCAWLGDGRCVDNLGSFIAVDLAHRLGCNSLDSPGYQWSLFRLIACLEMTGKIPVGLLVQGTAETLVKLEVERASIREMIESHLDARVKETQRRCAAGIESPEAGKSQSASASDQTLDQTYER